MRILHPYLPGHRPDDQRHCLDALVAASRDGWKVDSFPVDGTYGYARGLRERWGSLEDWIIVEHDVEVSIPLLEALTECPHDLCTAPYQGPDDALGFLSEIIRDGGQWAPRAILGATKIAARARRESACPFAPWQILDGMVTTALAEDSSTWWHVHHEHRPIHHHITVP
ncbi:MAG: hypothetical protein ACYCV4_02560 [Dermatophilaceae bacterium]